jgi:hypothetical protein
MVCYRLTSIRSLARFLREQPELAKICGFKDGQVPSYRTFCRRFKCLESWICQWCRIILTFLIDARFLKLKILVNDGTPCRSAVSEPKELGGRTRVSDPEARFGCYRHQPSKKKEWFFGYKTIILVSSEPLIVPLAWLPMPANLQEINHLIPTVSKASWLLEEEKYYELVADAGNDSQNNYEWCKKINVRLTCPLNQARKPKGKRLEREKFYKSKLGQKLYKRRTDLERLNGQLKDLFLIDPLPVRGLKNVRVWISLVMLAYLACVYYNCINGRRPRAIKSLIA